MRLALATACILLLYFSEFTRADNATVALGEHSPTLAPARTTLSQEEQEISQYGETLRNVVARVMASIPDSVRTQLLGADVRPECSVGLLRTMRAFQNLEPWTFRLLDATGKYPTGMLRWSRSDIGAFDECIATVVRDSFGNEVSRGQYCNLLVYVKKSKTWEKALEAMLNIMHPKARYYKAYFSYNEISALRIGICFVDDCNQQDLQALANIVNSTLVRIEVSNCVTAEPEPWNAAQKGIGIFLCILAVIVASATGVDVFIQTRAKRDGREGSLLTTVKAFSVVSNTRMLLRTAKKSDGEHYVLQFLHGLRFFSLAHIVLGHCYERVTDSSGTLMNILILSDRWLSMLIAAAYDSVETFFFLSGFFLCLTVGKQKANPLVIFFMGSLRRLIRICVPLFFIIMCLCLLPVFVTGPDTKSFYQKLYDEVSSDWWRYLLQIRNFYKIGAQHVLAHTWYLSADSQLFAVSLLTLALLQGRKALAIGAFTLLALLGYAIAAWALESSDSLPFLIFPEDSPERYILTVNLHYIQPFIHALPYFSGCITFLIMDDFRKRKITKTMQAAGWCIATSCGLCCVFMKLAWYKSPDPTSKAGTLIASFSDRVMWSLMLAWITLACSSGRGGFVGKFLSWNLFVPLSKLSFGVYLIHYPFIELLLYSSRERIHWSDFNQVTMLFSVLDWSFILAYFSYLACEAPTAVLEKLAFSKLTGGGRAREQERKDEVNQDSASPEKKTEDVFSRC